ncbi:cupredoxin domain-containing protein [Mesobacillus maritimus]|uniref:cupredoxin domain-containing protein n=1 Tax=Mesobacillus maritimus TaxID=1643336 RepID=UPI00203E9236|nr:cupredoxin domain-containing protein [Mesobacillus maritimus]MCM3586575.1 cupredoxin domain-containing protein [Mesobacillus maritimus]
MFVKNRISGLIVMLAMIVTTLGSLSVSAATVVETNSMETVKPIVVELNDHYFNPKNITIPEGTSTTLILKNKGKVEHTFTVENLEIDAEVQPGKEKTISVKPKQSGTYELICRYHVQQGMVGKVIVK